METRQAYEGRVFLYENLQSDCAGGTGSKGKCGKSGRRRCYRIRKADIRFANLRHCNAAPRQFTVRIGSRAPYFASYRDAAKGLNAKSDALHGEKVGVGTLIAAREYHAVTENDDIAWSDYPKIDDEYIADFFGDKLCQSIIDENKNDTALGIHGSDITANMDGIRKIISEIPSVEDLSVIYKRLNMKSTLDDIGVDGKKESIIKEYSPLVRNRLTLMRLRRCGF